MRGRPLSRLALPLRALAERFALAVLLLAAVALLLISKADLKLIEATGTRLGDAVAPLLSAVARPVEGARDAAEHVGNLIALREENERLRAQNARLLEWQAAARALRVENEALRRTLSMPARGLPPTAVTARVIADTGGPFVQTLLVDAGAPAGVRAGMAVVNERGLVGRVIEVGRRSARVLLLTDFNSRIPIRVEASGDHAILAGDNSRRPRLIFLPLNPTLAVGDRVLTSGRGGVLPPGVPVGVIEAIGEQGVLIAPAVDGDRLDYVRLLTYDPVLTPEQAPAVEPAGAPMAQVPAAPAMP